MIDVFFYSVAGKKTNKVIDELVAQFLSADYVPDQEKKILKHVQEVAKNGNYPSREYFAQFYTDTGMSFNSLAEIRTYVTRALDFYHLQSLSKKTMSLLNESTTSAEYMSGISKMVETDVADEEDIFEDYRPITYADVMGKPETKGCMIGIPEVDQLTNGLQGGTIASFCGFTGHGKSTLVLSTLFKNAMEGKKECLFSLELAPELVWMQLQARYLYEIKGMQVTGIDLIQHKLPSEMKEKVAEYDADYRRDIVNNIMILDESYLKKSTVLDEKLLAALFRKIEKKLGGLNVVAFDHVGQFELMYPECGNQIIRKIQVVTKTFITDVGEKVSTIFAVQTNREGVKRAKKRNGVYDLQAISDLNEVERSSTYCIFLYTSDEMKIVQETKVCMLKHRLGSVLPEPVTTTFNPAVYVVGSTVEKLAMSADDFAQMDGLDFGDMDDF